MRLFAVIFLGFFSSVVMADETAKESCLTLGRGNNLTDDAPALILAYMDQQSSSGLQKLFWETLVANKAHIADRYGTGLSAPVSKCYTPARGDVWSLAGIVTGSSRSMKEFAMTTLEQNRNYWGREIYRRSLSVILSEKMSGTYEFHDRAWKEFRALGAPTKRDPSSSFGPDEIQPINSYREIIELGYVSEYRDLATEEFLAFPAGDLKDLGDDFFINHTLSSIVREAENQVYVARASARLIERRANSVFLADVARRPEEPYRGRAINEMIAHLSGGDKFERRQAFSVLRKLVEQAPLPPHYKRQIADALDGHPELKSR